MATIGTLNLTYSDWAKRHDPNGQVATIIELLSKESPLMQDAIVVEGNLPDGHKTTVRTGIPSATWRMLNYGVQPTKSRTTQVTDKCGMLETFSKVDSDLARMSGNLAEFRLSEDMAFLEGMTQQLETAVFYGNGTTDAAQITGLSARYSSTTASNGANIIKAGGSDTDNTSIWLICWDYNTVHLTFPKGSKAGFQRKDLGEKEIEDEDGNEFMGYKTHYKWDVGLVVRDWRYVVRICNIDVSGIASVNLIDLMSQAMETVKSIKGKPVFYMNRTVRTELRRQVAAKANVNLQLNTAGGKRIEDWDGIPVHMTDALINAEALVA